MKAMAICGSPRKEWNTAQALTKALEGAASLGAETELVHLYDIDYKGCRSCFACKQIGGESYGRCACRDGLTDVLRRAEEADVLIIGSPLYFADVTGATRAMMERLMFPHFSYDPKNMYNWPKKTHGAFIYTMGGESFEFFKKPMKISTELTLASLMASFETLVVEDTYQFPDYDKYYAPMFSSEHKKERRETQFPRDLQAAYELGRRLAERALA